jgi:DedD protein
MSETIDGLKQRLVGAFVILSLAVIFLPMIFDNPHEVKKVTIKEVPPKPSFQNIVIEKPKRPTFKVVDLDSSDNKVKKIDQIANKKDNIQVKAGSVEVKKTKEVPLKPIAAKKPSQTTPAVSHLPIFKNIWMVQLGTFSRTKNAYELRDRLRKDGFDGHAKDITIKGKKAVRVFSGPFVNRKEAEKIKKKLDKRYRVKSLIIYFDA